ncbi:hypothetical protein R3W88_026738 [Solanum pinnatisectum]|uniref:Nodule Cysteine-Rich (NCR) secreted peptide n=1 Tax=Solanum pinnatisectum TaxID=50273 RepID=A0AAV9LF24_9SOLN|nr:hypothetical protein R3W88_026738 [Solanum pinnatisectum]
MEKATFLKVFLISFLLMLFGKFSYQFSIHAVVGCTKDADCVNLRCVETQPKCDLAKHQCICPTPPNYGTKRVHKTDQN